MVLCLSYLFSFMTKVLQYVWDQNLTFQREKTKIREKVDKIFAKERIKLFTVALTMVASTTKCG